MISYYLHIFSLLKMKRWSWIFITENKGKKKFYANDFPEYILHHVSGTKFLDIRSFIILRHWFFFLFSDVFLYIFHRISIFIKFKNLPSTFSLFFIWRYKHFIWYHNHIERVSIFIRFFILKITNLFLPKFCGSSWFIRRYQHN